MKKPFIRVTKWMGDIPLEAECTSCADVKFQVRSTSHRPSREEYQKVLQRDFDHHFKVVHSLDDPGKAGATNPTEKA